METLSRDTVFQLLLNLSGANLLNFCATNTTISSICDERNDYFWRTKVFNDYSNVPNKPDNLSWKRFYILLGTTRQFIKQVPITYKDRQLNEWITLGQIWINNTDTPDQILLRANQIFLKRYPNDDPDQLTIVNNKFYIFWSKPISAPQLFNFNPTYYNMIQQLRYVPASSVPRGAMRYITHRPPGR